MQVGKIDNNTSFGIKTINYTNFKARDTYRKLFLRGNNDTNKVHQTFNKIFDLKPKSGPDVDLFITKCENEFDIPELLVQVMDKNKKVLASDYIGNQSNDYRLTKNIDEFYNLCKKLVNSVNKK